MARPINASAPCCQDDYRRGTESLGLDHHQHQRAGAQAQQRRARIMQSVFSVASRRTNSQGEARKVRAATVR